MGCFYIKPNFPGRASHICNGGFIASPNFRRLGVAKFLAACFESLAQDLGYRASFFNLVFASNTASLQLWRSLPQYKQTGCVPNAIRRKDGSFVDAYQFYNEFGANKQSAAAATGSDAGAAAKK